MAVGIQELDQLRSAFVVLSGTCQKADFRLVRLQGNIVPEKISIVFNRESVSI